MSDTTIRVAGDRKAWRDEKFRATARSYYMCSDCIDNIDQSIDDMLNSSRPFEYLSITTSQFGWSLHVR